MRWFYLRTRSCTSTQNSSSIQHALFIDAVTFGGSACSSPRPHANTFALARIAVANQNDIVVSARKPGSCFVNQHALTAIVHTRIVLRIHHVREAHELRPTVD